MRTKEGFITYLNAFNINLVELSSCWISGPMRDDDNSSLDINAATSSGMSSYSI